MADVLDAPGGRAFADNEGGGERDALWRRSFIPALARMAMDQAEKRLADFLEIRRATEAKTASLFGVFVSVALAISGLAAALAQRIAVPTPAVAGSSFTLPWWLAPGLLVAVLFFFGAACVLGFALRPGWGSFLGGTIEFWLSPDAEIDGDGSDSEAQAARHYALAALDFERRCTLQEAINEQRLRLLNIAIALGFCGALVFSGVLWSLVVSRAL